MYLLITSESPLAGSVLGRLLLLVHCSTLQHCLCQVMVITKSTYMILPVLCLLSVCLLLHSFVLSLTQAPYFLTLLLPTCKSSIFSMSITTYFPAHFRAIPNSNSKIPSSSGDPQFIHLPTSIWSPKCHYIFISLLPQFHSYSSLQSSSLTYPQLPCPPPLTSHSWTEATSLKLPTYSVLVPGQQTYNHADFSTFNSWLSASS